MVLAALVALAALPAGAGAKTVWLCKPGLADNPCEPSLKTTVFSPSGQKLSVESVKRAKKPKFDCFYVYPTVSDQKTTLANFNIDPELKSIALYQASRYSRDCRVFAPVYRQITLNALFNGGASKAEQKTAYGDVRRAWREYLVKYNKGRGVVFIGHSQGSFMLRRLLSEKVDPKVSARKRLISALLLGGNVEVKAGSDRGGDFQNIPACRSKRQFGCVIAFSTFNATPPAGALFGRAGPGREVLCTNPTDLGGGSGRATPIFPTAPFAPGTTIGAGTLAVGFTVPQASTPWASFPNAYKARCSSEANANVLRIEPLNGAPTLNAIPTAGWGLHLTDANIALGNLADLVRRQAAAYVKSRG